MIKNIIFDFNGTILDDLQVSFDSVNACIDKYLNNAPHETMEHYLENFSFPVYPYYKQLGFDLDNMDYIELSDYFISYYQSRAFKECKLYPEVEDTLKELKEKGYKLIILSASFKDLLIAQLKDLNIYDYFDGIIAHENKFAGSKIDNAKNYFNANNIIPSECIMIGDTVHDIEVANSLEVNCVSFDRGHNSRNRLLQHNKNVIHNFSELLNYIK